MSFPLSGVAEASSLPTPSIRPHALRDRAAAAADSARNVRRAVLRVLRVFTSGAFRNRRERARAMWLKANAGTALSVKEYRLTT